MNKNSLPFFLYSASQVRTLDRIAIEVQGIPGICLMERAGSAAFDILKSLWPQARRITVLCGIGNNGGDGYVLARLAHLAGYEVIVSQLGNTAKLKGDALLAFEAMIKVGCRIQQEFTEQQLSLADVVVDAIFGTGLDREVTGKWREVIVALNNIYCPRVLSMDIPSGLHADTGSVLGVAVRATVTVSFIGLKQGLFTGFGPDYCGSIYFDDLKVPLGIYFEVQTSITRLDYKELKSALSKRPRSAHKGKFGHVLIIGGDSGMIGAARLAAEAAARVGAGKVSVATRASHAALLNLTRPEIMSHGVETVAELESLLDKVDVIAIGPGLGTSAWGRTLLEAIKTVEKPLVVDADALNLLAQTPFFLKHSVLTPHPGEAATLLGKSSTEIQADRFATVRSLQQKFGGVCVLKGAGTLVANVDGEIGICTAGNPGMACGGMGDVLTGIIVGLLAQGFSSIDAANLGVCLHAKAGDHVAQEGGERGLLPSDLLPWLRYYANPTLLSEK